MYKFSSLYIIILISLERLSRQQRYYKTRKTRNQLTPYFRIWNRDCFSSITVKRKQSVSSMIQWRGNRCFLMRSVCNWIRFKCLFSLGGTGQPCQPTWCKAATPKFLLKLKNKPNVTEVQGGSGQTLVAWNVPCSVCSTLTGGGTATDHFVVWSHIFAARIMGTRWLLRCLWRMILSSLNKIT